MIFVGTVVQCIVVSFSTYQRELKYWSKHQKEVSDSFPSDSGKMNMKVCTFINKELVGGLVYILIGYAKRKVL